jgi:hypothetical protein
MNTYGSKSRLPAPRSSSLTRHRTRLAASHARRWLTLTAVASLAPLHLSGQHTLDIGALSSASINKRLDAAKAITEPFQERALEALVLEANCVARSLSLPEELPITRTRLSEFFILPRQGNLAWKAVGKIVTRHYAYYASKENKFCYLERVNPEQDIATWLRTYRWPISRMDTNGARGLATQWLQALSFDVEALNRDCNLRVKVDTLTGQTEGATFTPLYTVYWVKGREGRGSAASVRLFTPTQTLLQLRVEDPKYNLRAALPLEQSAVQPTREPLHIVSELTKPTDTRSGSTAATIGK